MDVVRRQRAAALVVAGALLLVAVLVATSRGVTPLPTSGILSTLLDRIGVEIGTPLGEIDARVLLDIRLPRVLLVALVGGVLALAGASYQGVFRNPLADPYLLGAAAGAGLGATLVIAFVPQGFGPLGTLPIAAFVGALTGVALAYGLGTAAGRGQSGSATLLLAGVAVSSFLTALQTLVQQAHTDNLRQVYGWILGQLGTADWPQLVMVLPYMAVSTVVMLASARALDVLAVGDDEATTLGVRPRRVRFAVLVAASLGTAAAVAVSGLIGFVGLVVPHIVRRLAGGSYRTVLPVSLLGGAAFLVLADLLARTVIAPGELPIGVVTAFVGAPFFAALLRVGGGSS
ncbi:iron ABC transporter permease [Kineosporia sp. R_H_3]|uniref:FecCD family ABC transporter permease n=1 Tax=Kineosporia sp. R_H_3 TaxID=1961848 RepID=UPI000B4B769D|nr:iron ABC transporter permease [Kineosporia sp. R_H_3]MBI4943553.1 iron ABC transporter permease [Actinomycetota bacterium]